MSIEQNAVRSNIALQAKRVRRVWRRFTAQQSLRGRGYPGLGESPVLFANSFPKSGTHLLTQVLEAFPQVGPAVNSGLPAAVMYEGATGRERSMTEILRDLSYLGGGDIGYGHLHALPEIVRKFSQENFCCFFILRDPRDVVVSHVHYVTDIEPGHVHHEYYAHVLDDFNERLRTSILGRPEAPNPFLDIAGRFKPFMDWLETPEVLTLRYEDFLADRNASVQRVLQHAVARGFKLFLPEEVAVQRLAGNIEPRRSPTFRQGRAGGWRSMFSSENSDLFKQVAGDLLIQLGYEKDNDW